jgi:AAA domain/DnaB-like helicase N terminal domain
VTALNAPSVQRAVLGSAMLDNSLMRGPLAGLSVTDFVGSSDQALYRLMLELSEENCPFDPITICDELRQRGKLEQVGAEAYVASLLDGAVGDVGLISGHVKSLQKLSRLRLLRSLGEKLQHNTGVVHADPDLLLEALKRRIRALDGGYDLNGNLLPYGSRDLSHPDLVTLSNVEARAVNWLWKPYLPLGMLAMLSGDPGGGKTYIAFAIAAAVTIGKVPFTGEPRKPADVVYLSMENSAEHVIRPRFDLLDGDASRFHLLRGFIIGSGNNAERGTIRLTDLRLLSETLEKTSAQLLIVDPIQSYLGADIDAHRSNETRPVLDGLAHLAEEHEACLLLVRHLSKAPTGKAIHRGLGSIDFTGAVRTELLAGNLPDEPTQRVLVHLKSNLGQLGSSLGYAIEADGVFRWTGESQATAGELLAAEAAPEERSEIKRSCEFLQDALADGLPHRVTELVTDSGVSERTLRRAARRLGVQRSRTGEKGPWLWKLPSA